MARVKVSGIEDSDWNPVKASADSRDAQAIIEALRMIAEEIKRLRNDLDEFTEPLRTAPATRRPQPPTPHTRPRKAT